MTGRVTVRRLATPDRVRICIVEELDGMRRDQLPPLLPADARRVARELWEAADQADIEATGGVPPTVGA